uniref:Methyltransferase, putative n=1 Tax=uncultured marine bacterium 583 TaxID=257403 RepID=Q6SET4_9BACT|nr:methyltransferase, putative [uncultured marine bacterium 583]
MAGGQNFSIRKNEMQNSFSIISGKFRGRKFSFPDVEGLRPTSGKIRETLFNWLQFDIINKTALDPFAGSGALSLEAISRGAKEVYVIEKDKVVYEKLKYNFKLLDRDQYTIINEDAMIYLAKPSKQSFDLVFLDPPFAKNLLIQTIEKLSNNNYINSQSQIYIESEYKLTEDNLSSLINYHFKINKQKKSGNVHYCLISLEAL